MPIWQAEIKQHWWSDKFHVYAIMSGGHRTWVASFLIEWMAEKFIEDVYNKHA